MTDPNKETQNVVLDPVCGMFIDPDKAAAKIDHGIHTHYFCSDACRKTFEEDPKRFH